MKIEAGDVVQLKTGGPKMTVESTYSNVSNREIACCVWFDDQNQLCTKSIEMPALNKVNES